MNEKRLDLMRSATLPTEGSGEAKKTMSTILEATFNVKSGAPWNNFEPPIMVIRPLSSPEEFWCGLKSFFNSDLLSVLSNM